MAEEKAESQLADLRKAESNSQHNFDMLEQSLKAQAAADGKDMTEEKASKAQAEEDKADAGGALELTNKKLSSAEETLKTASASCMQTAADHEATVAARKEELGVIAKALEILKSTSTGAMGQTYSLLQLASGSRLQGRAGLA